MTGVYGFHDGDDHLDPVAEDIRGFILNFIAGRVIVLMRENPEVTDLYTLIGEPGSETDKALRREAFDTYWKERGLDQRLAEGAYLRLLAQEDQDEAAKRDARGPS